MAEKSPQFARVGFDAAVTISTSPFPPFLMQPIVDPRTRPCSSEVGLGYNPLDNNDEPTQKDEES